MMLTTSKASYSNVNIAETRIVARQATIYSGSSSLRFSSEFDFFIPCSGISLRASAKLQYLHSKWTQSGFWLYTSEFSRPECIYCCEARRIRSSISGENVRPAIKNEELLLYTSGGSLRFDGYLPNATISPRETYIYRVWWVCSHWEKKEWLIQLEIIVIFNLNYVFWLF